MRLLRSAALLAALALMSIPARSATPIFNGNVNLPGAAVSSLLCTDAGRNIATSGCTIPANQFPPGSFASGSCLQASSATAIGMPAQTGGCVVLSPGAQQTGTINVSGNITSGANLNASGANLSGLAASAPTVCTDASKNLTTSGCVGGSGTSTAYIEETADTSALTYVASSTPTGGTAYDFDASPILSYNSTTGKWTITWPALPSGKTSWVFTLHISIGFSLATSGTTNAALFCPVTSSTNGISYMVGQNYGYASGVYAANSVGTNMAVTCLEDGKALAADTTTTVSPTLFLSAGTISGYHLELTAWPQ